jgi:hypothetical protein
MRLEEHRTSEAVLTLSRGYRVIASVKLPATAGPQLVQVVNDGHGSMDNLLDSESDRRPNRLVAFHSARSPQARTPSNCAARTDDARNASASSTATYTRRSGEITLPVQFPQDRGQQVSRRLRGTATPD